MTALVSLLAQAQPLVDAPDPATAADGVTRALGPSVDWWALAPAPHPVGRRAAAAHHLVADARPGSAARSTPCGPSSIASAAAISAIPLWAGVQGWDTVLWWTNAPDQFGPYSTVGGMVGIDGFSIFITVVICARGRPRRAPRRRLPASRGPGRPRALRAHAAVGLGRRDHGDGQRPHRGLPRPRDAVDRRLRARGDAPAARRSPRRRASSTSCSASFSSAFFLYGIALVYGATGSTNLIDIKDFMSAGRAGPERAAAARPRPSCSSAWPSRSPPCRSMPGARTSTTARRPRWWRSWPRWSRSPRSPASSGSSCSRSRTTARRGDPIVYVLAVLSMVFGSALAIVQSTSSGCWPTRRSATPASSSWRSRRPRTRATPRCSSTSRPTPSWSSARSAS